MLVCKKKKGILWESHKQILHYTKINKKPIPYTQSRIHKSASTQPLLQSYTLPLREQLQGWEGFRSVKYESLPLHCVLHVLSPLPSSSSRSGRTARSKNRPLAVQSCSENIQILDTLHNKPHLVTHPHIISQ